MGCPSIGWSLAIGAIVLAAIGCSVPDVVLVDGSIADAATDGSSRDANAPPDTPMVADTGSDLGSDSAIVDVVDASPDIPAIDLPVVDDTVATDVAPLPDVPPIVDAPDVTDVPPATDVPTVDVPAITDMPTVTDVPIVTDTPAPVDVLSCPSGQSLCGAVCLNLANDANNCGACGHVCSIAGAMSACESGTCVATMCLPGRGHCTGPSGAGCETDLTSSVSNCGVCGNVCSDANATPTCSLGTCGLGACNAGYGNCDGMASNGCETNLAVSTSHCGACGTACTPPADGTVACVASACAITCAAGYMLSAGACIPVPNPRQIAPLSTALVSRQTPTLHWQLATGTDGAHVELSRTRNFAVVSASFDATGTSGAPATALTQGTWFWRLHGRSSGSVGTSTSAVWQFWVGARSAPFDNSYGTNVDLNGDGYADVAVGATETNAAYIYPGSPSGPPSTPTVTLNAPSGGLFGWVVTSLGDINGDGFSDLGVSAPITGRVSVYLGGPSGIASVATTTLSAPAGITEYGQGLSAVGDINRDGYGDIVVGTGSNVAYVYAGSATGLVTTPGWTLNGPSGSAFSAMIVGLGDVNGDGFADVVASGGSAGAAYVFLGNAIGLPSAPSVTLTAPSVAGFGGIVIATQDANGDGLNDMLVSGSGSTVGYSYLGSMTGFGTPSAGSITLRSAVASMTIVANVGDLNSDGFSDLGFGSLMGSMAVVSVALGGLTPYASGGGIFLNSFSSESQNSLSGVGDMNGDGVVDCGVGSPETGTVNIHLGASPTPHFNPDFMLINMGNFGWSVACLPTIPSTGLRRVTAPSSRPNARTDVVPTVGRSDGRRS